MSQKLLKANKYLSGTEFKTEKADLVSENSETFMISQLSFQIKQLLTQLAFTSSNLAMETSEQYLKSVQILQYRHQSQVIRVILVCLFSSCNRYHPGLLFSLLNLSP